MRQCIRRWEAVKLTSLQHWTDMHEDTSIYITREREGGREEGREEGSERFIWGFLHLFWHRAGHSTVLAGRTVSWQISLRNLITSGQSVYHWVMAAAQPHSLSHKVSENNSWVMISTAWPACPLGNNTCKHLVSMWHHKDTIPEGMIPEL